MDMMTTMLAIIAVLFLFLVVCIAIIVISAPVCIPYFKSAISKNKYALFMVHDNGAITIEPAKFANSRAILSNGLAGYIKQGLKGSYTVGNIRCDLVHSEVAPMIEDSTLGVFDELKRAGINDIHDLITRANQATLISMGILNQKEFSKKQLEQIKLSRDYMLANTKLLTPAIRELNVHDMMANCEISPQRIAADSEEQIALVAKQYTTMLLGKKEDEGKSGGSLNPKTVMIIGVVILFVAMGAVFLMNGGFSLPAI